MVNLTSQTVYTIGIECGWPDVVNDGERFYMDYFNLTKVKYFGELSLETNPLLNDTDKDHIQDRNKC